MRLSRLFRRPKPRHLNGDIDVLHVGTTLEGHFPVIEQKCPCPKAPCGLVVTSGHPCQHHDGSQLLLQFHSAKECSFQRSFA